MKLTSCNKEILKDVIWILSEGGGMVFNDPYTIRKQAVEMLKKVEADYVSNRHFSRDEYNKWQNKETARAQNKFALADELEGYLNVLVEKSGGSILWGNNQLIIDAEYAMEMLNQAQKNAIGFSRGFGDIGGSANYFNEVDQYATFQTYKNEIIPTFNRFIRSGQLSMVAVPVKIKETDSFYDLAKLMCAELDEECRVRASLIGTSVEQLGEFVGIDRFYDTYCPHISRLNLQSEYFCAMLKSVNVGLNQGIASMLRFPFDGNSPKRILTFSATGLIAMIACSLTINPNVKILSGVMLGSSLKNGDSYNLRETWMLNAAWGKFVQTLGIDAELSVGTGTNEVAYNEIVKKDNADAYNFFMKYCPDHLFRHCTGYLNLEVFNMEKFREDMNNYPMINGHANDLWVPTDNKDIKNILNGPIDEWACDRYIEYHPVFKKMAKWVKEYFD